MLIAWSTVIFGMVLVLIGVAGILVFQSEAPEQSFFEQMTLRVLSQQWVRHKPSIKIERVKHISELTHLWRDELLIAQRIVQDEWTHPQSCSFSRQLRTWPFFQEGSQATGCVFRTSSTP